MSIEISPNIYWIGTNDRTTDLFEGLWPIEDGVSYNAYLIRDKKPVLIDLVKSSQVNEFIGKLEELIDLKDLNQGFIVINHMEPDHSGLLKAIRRFAPDVKIVGTRKALDMVKAFFNIHDGLMEVDDEDTLEIGDKKLEFYLAPLVHWPETMVTFDRPTGILFSCDAFGGYGALRGSIFDDELPEDQMEVYLEESLRYYANIVAKFSNPVLKAIKKIAPLPIKIIAPSHGIIWRKDPRRIVNLYKKWAEYSKGSREKIITLIYASMYGNTEAMMNSVARGIAKVGVPVEIFDAARTPVTYILSALWKNEGVMVGTPTYETEMFPPVAHVLDMARRKRINNRKAALFGSFGWSGGAKREWMNFVEALKWDVIEEYEFKGGPTKEDLLKGEEFGERFARKVQE
ncbi:MAG: FprA family A-type flavoprotein [Candidatus Hodarchaeota archaeon]